MCDEGNHICLHICDSEHISAQINVWVSNYQFRFHARKPAGTVIDEQSTC